MSQNKALKLGRKAQKKTLKTKPKTKNLSRPIAMGRIVQVRDPIVNGQRGFVVRHTEYLDDIYADAKWHNDPDVNVYQLNPGLTSSFPWLGNIAAGFEQYRWRKLVFKYVTRSQTSAAGAIYLATQRDSADPPFASKEEMYAYSGTQSGVRWADLSHNCLLNKSDYLKKYFVRTGDLVAGQDSQLYDAGNFTFVGVAQNDATYIGDLIVEYEVELFNPKMNVNLLGSTLSFRTNTGTAAAPFSGAADVVQAGVREFVRAGGDSIRFPTPGVYQLDLRMASDEKNSVSIARTPGIMFSQVTQAFVTNDNSFTTSYYVYVPMVLGTISYVLSNGATVQSWLKVSSVPLEMYKLLSWTTNAPNPNPEES